MKTILSNVVILLTFASEAFAQQIVPTFSNGTTVACVASHNIGNNGKGFTQEQMQVFYRIDKGHKKAHAYFSKVVQIGNYSFDGSCGEEVCSLMIRDQRTNTVSSINAAYAKLNSYAAQVQIMNFSEDLTLTLNCQLQK